MRLSLATALIFGLLCCPVRAEQLPSPVTGPKLICFKYSRFSLAEGERVTEFVGGFEGMVITVLGPDGEFTIGESEIFGRNLPSSKPVLNRGGMMVFHLKPGTDKYLIAGPTRFSSGSAVPLIELNGKALARLKTSAKIYRRFTVGDPTASGCDHTFTYDWGYLQPVEGGDTRP